MVLLVHETASRKDSAVDKKNGEENEKAEKESTNRVLMRSGSQKADDGHGDQQRRPTKMNE